VRAFFTALLTVAVLVAAAPLAGTARAERADNVRDLSRAVVHGKRVKTRTAAAVSLGRLRDPRSLKPLIRALRDPSRRVRAQAATALGRLGDPAALPALRRAVRDSSRMVRDRVVLAIEEIRGARPVADGEVVAARTPAPDASANREAVRLPSYVAPQQAPAAPADSKIRVMLKSASDESAGQVARQVRATRASQLRSLMLDRLAQNREVTLVATYANGSEKPGEGGSAPNAPNTPNAPNAAAPAADAPYAIDLTVKKLTLVARGANIEIACEIRVAISTAEGKMLSFLTGGAKVQVPKATFRDEFLPQHQREALEGAVRSVHRDLVAYLGRLQRS
jgi:HEAT repeats